MAPPYGSFIGWLIHVHVRPYMYARPAAALWNCHGMAPIWAGTGSHRSRQDSLTLCFRSDCHKHQNSVAGGCQNSRDNGVPTDVYMYDPLKDTDTTHRSIQGRSVILGDPLHVWTSCSKVVGALPKVSHIDVSVCSP